MTCWTHYWDLPSREKEQLTEAITRNMRVVDDDRHGCLCMKRIVIWLGAVTLVLQSLAACSRIAAPALTVSPRDGFIPGQVLASLPLYPGATPTTILNTGSQPPSYPMNEGLYDGPRRSGYQSASAQYTVNVTDEEVLDWYTQHLRALGYRSDGEGRGAGGGIVKRERAFFLPSQPFVSVQVHTYWGHDVGFELLVVHDVPLPKPASAGLPADIESVEITYFRFSRPAIINTVTAHDEVERLVAVVNLLPVRPDYLINQPATGPETVFRLVFHSPGQGDIEVTEILGGDGGGVHIADQSILWDVHHLLRDEVERLVGLPQ